MDDDRYNLDIEAIWNASEPDDPMLCWACEAKPGINGPQTLCDDCYQLPTRKTLMMAQNHQRARLGLPLIEGDLYHLDALGHLVTGSRGVCAVKPGHIEFRCPCDLREVTVTSPPHGITFEEHDGRQLLTLKGSCGMEAQGDLPAHWCHFTIEQGKPTMCGDAQCPGLKDA